MYVLVSFHSLFKSADSDLRNDGDGDGDDESDGDGDGDDESDGDGDDESDDESRALTSNRLPVGG